MASLELPFGIKNLNPSALDAKYTNDGVVYATILEANTILDSGIRHIGLTVNIANIEYWYKDGVADIDLVAKAGGGGASQLSDLSDVTTAAVTDGFALMANGAAYAGRALVEADISDFGTYDNYASFNLKTDNVQRTTITSGGDIDLVGGTDISVSYSAGGVATFAYTGATGVSTTGTPAVNQLAVFTDATTVQGLSGLTFDGTDLVVTGSIQTTNANGPVLMDIDPTGANPSIRPDKTQTNNGLGDNAGNMTIVQNGIGIFEFNDSWQTKWGGSFPTASMANTSDIFLVKNGSTDTVESFKLGNLGGMGAVNAATDSLLVWDFDINLHKRLLIQDLPDPNSGTAWQLASTSIGTANMTIDLSTFDLAIRSNVTANRNQLTLTDTGVILGHINTGLADYHFFSNSTEATLQFGSTEGISIQEGNIHIYDYTTDRGMAYLHNYRTNGVSVHGDRWIPDWQAVGSQLGGQNVDETVLTGITQPFSTVDGFVVYWDNGASQYALKSVEDVGTDLIWDAKGDLAVGTGANTAIRLAAGTNGYVLSANSATGSGLEWITAPGASYTFTNGVTESGGTVKLGGSLVDAATQISMGEGKEFEIRTVNNASESLDFTFLDSTLIGIQTNTANDKSTFTMDGKVELLWNNNGSTQTAQILLNQGIQLVTGGTANLVINASGTGDVHLTQVPPNADNASDMILMRSAATGYLEKLTLGTNLSINAGALDATGGGVTIGDTEVAYATSANTLGGKGTMIFDDTTDRLTVSRLSVSVGSAVSGFSTGGILVRESSGALTVLSSAGTSTGRFLKDDGTWDTPAGGGGNFGGTVTTNEIAFGTALDTLGGEANFTYDGTGTVKIGDAFTTEEARLWVGGGRSGVGTSRLDLVGEFTYTSWGLSLVRSSTVSSLLHRGTGALNINSQEAGDISFNYNTAGQNIEAILIGNKGTVALSQGNGMPSSASDDSYILNIHRNSADGAYIHMTNDTTGTGTADGFHFGLDDTENVTFRAGTDIGDMLFWTENTLRLTIANAGNLIIADGSDFQINTTTGTKIGTGTTQKIGFWNATPVAQPTHIADATDAATAISQLNLLLAQMATLGLQASS